MTTERQGAGPHAMRWLRQASGLTQIELSERSGVSERTIRGLERGQIRRPHQASLRELAAAGGLNESQRAAFLRAWSPGRTRDFAALGDRPDLVLAENIVQSEIECWTIAGWTEYQVGPSRHVMKSRTKAVIEAGIPETRTCSLVMLSTVPGQLPSNKITHTVGMTPLRRFDYPSAGIVVHEIEYERTLASGETIAIEYAIEPADPDRALFGELLTDPPDTEAGWSHHLTSEVSVVEVQFDTPPAAVWETHTPDLEGGDDVRRVELQADRRVRLALRSPLPGSYGFRWEWPDEADPV